MKNNYICFQVADLATIHESFQFLMKKYVDEELPDIQFLNLDDIRKRHEKKQKQEEDDTDDSDDEGLKASRPNRSRLVKI